ncbi:hypothetical protein BDV93DRAFT_367416 [Ceratobasidium sp. AG-I]|nr:hypothetical protein BDV93DRAFT_367416 [Ceratobasidium sp. AG-I]
MFHDPRVYALSHTFNPNRFLKTNLGPDPRKFAYGFGRRACPGVHLANNTIWPTCAVLLTAFDIKLSSELLSQVNDIGGRDSPEMYKLFEPFGVSAAPSPFLCSVKTRNPILVENLEGR